MEETVCSAMILSTKLIIRIVADADVRCCKRFSFFCYHHNYLFWYILSFPPLIPNCDSHFILVKMESLSRIRKKKHLIYFSWANLYYFIPVDGRIEWWENWKNCLNLRSGGTVSEWFCGATQWALIKICKNFVKMNFSCISWVFFHFPLPATYLHKIYILEKKVFFHLFFYFYPRPCVVRSTTIKAL